MVATVPPRSPSLYPQAQLSPHTGKYPKVYPDLDILLNLPQVAMDPRSRTRHCLHGLVRCRYVRQRQEQVCSVVFNRLFDLPNILTAVD